MDTNELLQIIINKLDNMDGNITGLKQKVDSIENDTKELHQKTDRLEQKTDRLEQKTDRLEQKTDELSQETYKLGQSINDLYQKINSIYTITDNLNSDIKYIKIVQLENNIAPRLQNIEACYTSTYTRYKSSVDTYDSILFRLDLIEKTVQSHSEKLNTL